MMPAQSVNQWAQGDADHAQFFLDLYGFCKPSDHVLEIGPGKGHITGLLLQSCRKLTAVEVDEKLYGRLFEKHNDSQSLRLCHQDFLQWRLPASESYKVFYFW